MANERSELILRVDDLTHKVLRCESEVAVGETFDLVFFGGRVWDGDSAKVFLYDDKERLLWSASGVVEARSDGAFVISGCVIDTEQAAAYANRGDKRGRRVYGELIRVDVEGERTDYGDFSFLLHKGVSADGTPLVKFLDDLSAHEVDGDAHEDIRQEIAQVETSILASVSQDLEEHAVVEETARNEAIHRAMMDLRSELEGGADGIGAGAVAEATRQAALAGEIAVGVADSARAAAVSAETASQAAKDGASYLNLIINASKSALASKDQAQAFATSSSEAKEAAEASVESVSSDRLAVETARDEVLDARTDVISAQRAVGGLLSSARESEAAARESASTASRAASDSESAKSAAESARDRAVVARDEAEAFAAGAARSAEASEASAVRSEKAAEVSAKETAENVTALLQGKVDAAEAAKAGAETAKTAAETAKTDADAAKTAAASSATSAANSAAAADKSATDLANAVSTAKSLDGRVSTIEGLGTQYKRDFRVDTTGLVNPLATSLSTSSPFASIYRRTNKGYDGRYFSDCQHHIFNDWDSAFIYDANGKYLGRITNTGIGDTVAHPAYQFACLTTSIGGYRYGIFNGYPYNRNKMIISKFARNADNTDYELVASRIYATRGVEGAIFQVAYNLHQTGPVVPSRRTGHILVFGDYYMSVKNDEGAIVDKYVGYGYIVFDSDLNFVKWDDTAGAFVSSDTFDMSYFHDVGGRPYNGAVAYWADTNAQYLSLVAIQQSTNAKNGLYYVDPHDNLVPITFSSGPYADAGIDYLPLGGSLLSVDSTALFSTYAPRLVMSGVESDDERGKAIVVKIFNGARMFYITMTLTDEEPGCTFTYGGNQTITQTQFNGSRISDNDYLFLHGKWSSAYSETQLFLYRNGYIYSSDGKYVKSLTLPTALAQISPQRGMYARSYHLQFAPCGGYTNPTGAVLLDM